MRCHSSWMSFRLDMAMEVGPTTKAMMVLVPVRAFAHSMQTGQQWHYNYLFQKKKQMIWNDGTCLGASHLNGSKASSVTIHGDIVVPKTDII